MSTFQTKSEVLPKNELELSIRYGQNKLETNLTQTRITIQDRRNKTGSDIGQVLTEIENRMFEQIKLETKQKRSWYKLESHHKIDSLMTRRKHAKDAHIRLERQELVDLGVRGRQEFGADGRERFTKRSAIPLEKPIPIQGVGSAQGVPAKQRSESCIFAGSAKCRQASLGTNLISPPANKSKLQRQPSCFGRRAPSARRRWPTA
jgi:hypothetical protein